MKPFTQLQGIAAPMPLDNVDTDAIIPSRETKSVARTGYGERLFANWRYQPGTRVEQPGFILNRPGWRESRILVAGRNFGCGSSREAAAWSLEQFGIRCVIAHSFGSIFRSNCVRNGVLPVSLDAAAMARLTEAVSAAPTELAVDLQQCTIEGQGCGRIAFTLDPLDREMLLQGADEIQLTLQHAQDIAHWQAADRLQRPWIWQARPHLQPHDA